MHKPLAAAAVLAFVSIIASACVARDPEPRPVGPGPAGSFGASAQGLPFATREAAALERVVPPRTGGMNGTDSPLAMVQISLTDASGACSPGPHPGTSELRLGVVQLGTSVMPGTFTIPPPNQKIADRGAEVAVFRYDGACGLGSRVNPVGGSVTLTRIDGSVVAGSFDLMFPWGPARGSFSAPVCLPPSWESMCPSTACQSGVRPGDATCTSNGFSTQAPGSWLTYCYRHPQGDLGGGATNCAMLQATPICVTGTFGGEARAACCPPGRTTPNDPGCVFPR